MAKVQNIRTPPTEPINVAIKNHQSSLQDWRYSMFLADFYKWAKRFDFEFKLKIPLPAIALDKLGGRRLGFFRFGRNGLGLKHEITIDQNHARSEAYWQVLGTLLHELLHLWQQAHGEPSNSSYHNKQYQEKALSLGLVVDRWGHTRYTPQNSAFLNVLTKYGIKTPEIPPLDEQQMLVGRLNSSKLKLWQCTCPVRVRVARDTFRAKCLVCGSVFRRTE